MCLACQMDDELWFAYLDHVAQQEKQAAAAGAAEPATDKPADAIKPISAAPATQFVCEEPPSE